MRRGAVVYYASVAASLALALAVATVPLRLYDVEADNRCGRHCRRKPKSSYSDRDGGIVTDPDLGYTVMKYEEKNFMAPDGKRPVLFVPGNAGAWTQCRSVGYVMAQFRVQAWLYCVDFGEELSALHGGLIHRQAAFVDRVVDHLCREFQVKEIDVVAHSMGGIVTLARTSRGCRTRALIGLAVPFMEPPALADANMTEAYRRVHTALAGVGAGAGRKSVKVAEAAHAHPPRFVVSYSGGIRDILVAQDSQWVSGGRVRATNPLLRYTASAVDLALTAARGLPGWVVANALADVVVPADVRAFTAYLEGVSRGAAAEARAGASGTSMMNLKSQDVHPEGVGCDHLDIVWCKQLVRAIVDDLLMAEWGEADGSMGFARGCRTTNDDGGEAGIGLPAAADTFVATVNIPAHPVFGDHAVYALRLAGGPPSVYYALEAGPVDPLNPATPAANCFPRRVIFAKPSWGTEIWTPRGGAGTASATFQVYRRGELEPELEAAMQMHQTAAGNPSGDVTIDAECLLIPSLWWNLQAAAPAHRLIALALAITLLNHHVPTGTGVYPLLVACMAAAARLAVPCVYALPAIVRGVASVLTRRVLPPRGAAVVLGMPVQTPWRALLQCECDMAVGHAGTREA